MTLSNESKLSLPTLHQIFTEMLDAVPVCSSGICLRAAREGSDGGMSPKLRMFFSFAVRIGPRHRFDERFQI